ncbi:MAG: DUF6345 domain-containing protein [Promethearchaeota archaeon]
MKKYAVLFLALIMILGPYQNPVEAPATVTTFDPSKYVLSQTQMPVFELVTPEVNETYVETMARSLTTIPEISAEETEIGFVVSYLNQTFEMDRRDGSMWYADYEKLWNVALGIEVPTPSSCKTDADAWLREKGLLPDNAVFANMGSTNVTTYTPDSDEIRTKVLQWHVNYELMMNDIPITGDAAQITVMIGEGGDTVGFNWKWREPKPEPYATFELIEYESVLDAHGIFMDEVVDHRLAYTTDDEPGSSLLYPVYEIEILTGEDEEGIAIHTLQVIDATLLNPQVEITAPSHGISVMPGTSITFDCSVAFGTPPYTYQWGSDFDGVLSTSKTFTTVSLSEVTKKGYPVPHAISVRVRDAEDRGCSDCIAVTIETVDFSMDPQITLVAVGCGALVIVSLLVFRRRSGSFALLFLLMMLSAFMFLPVSATRSEISDIRRISPSAPTGAYDDGIKEVGIEWVGMSHGKPLWNTETNIEGFYNYMGTVGGYNREFNWGEYSAWEEDFKDAQFSGTDTEWVDAVDFVYYQDHGGPNGVSFTSNHDDHGLHYLHMRLGDGDLDSIVFDACSPLAWENPDGDNVFDRWAPSMQGIHQVCSFATSSKNSATRGTNFAKYMTTNGMTIVNAWFRATLETEPSDHLAAVFYATKSPDPYNPQQDDPINDHAYGFGYVCSDPTPGTFGHYVYIVSSC